MILLDTNVASEPMKPQRDQNVMAWFNRQTRTDLCLSAISLGEMLRGIAAVPEGKRKEGLILAFAALRTEISQKILPYDAEAAMIYAELAGRAKRLRYTLPIADGQIAAIASLNGFTVATRDVEPFLAAGVAVVNPWEDE